MFFPRKTKEAIAAQHTQSKQLGNNVYKELHRGNTRKCLVVSLFDCQVNRLLVDYQAI
jgi:hypothetical protein